MVWSREDFSLVSELEMLVGIVEIWVQEQPLDYVDWFNYRRLHGEIGHVPPAEFEEMFYASRQEAGIKG